MTLPSKVSSTAPAHRPILHSHPAMPLCQHLAYDDHPVDVKEAAAVEQTTNGDAAAAPDQPKEEAVNGHADSTYEPAGHNGGEEEARRLTQMQPSSRSRSSYRMRHMSTRSPYVQRTTAPEQC